MTRYSAFTGILAAATALALHVAPAHAQLRTWVSGVGDDAHPCTRTAPCKTFAGAISKTGPGGEINCLDPVGFGVLTITKSITINCENTLGSVLVSGTNGINVSAGASDIVVLRGLELEGLGSGVIGINATTGTILHVQKCLIRNFRSGAAIGINYAPPPGVAGELYVSDTTISSSGASLFGADGGIVIRAGGTGSAKVDLNRVQIENNTAGVRVNGGGSSGGLKVTLRDSVVAGNSNAGVVAFSPSGGASITLLVNNTAAINNATG